MNLEPGTIVRQLGTDTYFTVTEVLFGQVELHNGYRKLTRKLSLEHVKWAYEEVDEAVGRDR